MTETIIRVLVLNIRHGLGLDGRIDLERQAALIRESGADLALLQEVDMGTARAGGAWQAKRLAELFGLRHWVFGASMPFDGGLYGNGVLARERVLSWSRLLLPGLPGGREPRSLLVCCLLLGGERITVCGTHWSLDLRERMRAARFLRRRWGRRLRRTMIGGDFNAGMRVLGRRTYAHDAPHAEIDLLATFLVDAAEACGCAPILTYPADRPAAPLDHLFVSPDITVLSAACLRTHVSDHLPVLVTVRL